MHIVIGQTDQVRTEAELRQVIFAIEKNAMGTGIPGYRASIAPLEPLKWAIKFSWAAMTMEDFDPDKAWGQNMLEVAKRIALHFGPGKYYFRGVKSEIDSFWDMSLESVCEDQDLFGGLPLSITIGQKNVIEVYSDWNHEFITKHYSDYITPFMSDIRLDDKLRSIFYAQIRLLALRGDWVFYMSSRNAELPQIQPAMTMKRRSYLAN